MLDGEDGRTLFAVGTFRVVLNRIFSTAMIARSAFGIVISGCTRKVPSQSLRREGQLAASHG